MKPIVQWFVGKVIGYICEQGDVIKHLEVPYLLEGRKKLATFRVKQVVAQGSNYIFSIKQLVKGCRRG